MSKYGWRCGPRTGCSGVRHEARTIRRTQPMRSREVRGSEFLLPAGAGEAARSLPWGARSEAATVARGSVHFEFSARLLAFLCDRRSLR